MQNKLNKTEILLNSAVYALYMLFTCLCIMVVEMLVVDLAIGKILSTFITFTSTSIYVIRTVISKKTAKILRQT